MNWKDLLEDFMKKAKKSPIDDQEKQTTDLFFEYLDYNENKEKSIPKFYYKKPINYNDLYFNIKTEAKNRFLSMKSYELPQKNRKIEFKFLILNFNKL